MKPLFVFNTHQIPSYSKTGAAVRIAELEGQSCWQGLLFACSRTRFAPLVYVSLASTRWKSGSSGHHL